MKVFVVNCVIRKKNKDIERVEDIFATEELAVEYINKVKDMKYKFPTTFEYHRYIVKGNYGNG